MREALSRQEIQGKDDPENLKVAGLNSAAAEDWAVADHQSVVLAFSYWHDHTLPRPCDPEYWLLVNTPRKAKPPGGRKAVLGKSILRD
ncbi:hypothetical protein PoB_000347600 [Plakobranchus ocellatus]|uniref:Uncharacterized protein n=1 Tax=Plakobranchus ocellatus TaxID=259542 RepID=A0AAV3XJA1_9GAST|nr:hypothetical protein PoB_000347600 [Plakobranchus ocellatus]